MKKKYFTENRLLSNVDSFGKDIYTIDNKLDTLEKVDHYKQYLEKNETLKWFSEELLGLKKMLINDSLHEEIEENGKKIIDIDTSGEAIAVYSKLKLLGLEKNIHIKTLLIQIILTDCTGIQLKPDGLWGAKTDGAWRKFRKSAALKAVSLNNV